MPVPSASIYFFAGDFVDVLRRFERGEQQTYATHNEVARLIHSLKDAGVRLTTHRFHPRDVTPKKLTRSMRYRVAYAGSITEDKGVGDLIRALALLRARGLEIQCTLAGAGAVETMQILGRSLGVGDLLSFRGIVG